MCKVMRNTIKVIAAMMLVAVLAAPLSAATIQLPAGAEVKLKFPAGVTVSSGSLEQGAPVQCELAEPLNIGGKALVEAGAMAVAKVSEVKKAGKAGKGGYIKVEFVELYTKGAYRTADGATIKLSGSVDSKGKNRKTLSFLLIFGLFISGKQGEIPSGTIFPAQVAETVVLTNE